jgi:hypothetical protein
MKSIHVANMAMAATVATLAFVAAETGSPERLVSNAFDRALASQHNGQQAADAAHGQNSEHFWLTQGAGDIGAHVKPALAPVASIPLADIKRAVAVAGALESQSLEILNVQPIVRATLGSAPPTGRSLLVSVRIAATARQPARLVKFVLDAAPLEGTAAARAL